jgi:hypothetical protein
VVSVSSLYTLAGQTECYSSNSSWNENCTGAVLISAAGGSKQVRLCCRACSSAYSFLQRNVWSINCTNGQGLFERRLLTFEENKLKVVPSAVFRLPFPYMLTPGMFARSGRAAPSPIRSLCLVSTSSSRRTEVAAPSFL